MLVIELPGCSVLRWCAATCLNVGSEVVCLLCIGHFFLYIVCTVVSHERWFLDNGRTDAS